MEECIEFHLLISTALEMLEVFCRDPLTDTVRGSRFSRITVSEVAERSQILSGRCQPSRPSHKSQTIVVELKKDPPKKYTRDERERINPACARNRGCYS